ncbi:radical SAM protein [Sedimentibacter hydroxybenzoicus DSM 7310]|uniref:Radical SAM protein n=1 Tax=Sedimentibacter hydroxybenzoicus DSM 7310 TaxID=1123245 RepID=A0A974BK21_SEDHY|nr:radical SAM protein [Sedimentibacter hydroxybenzoicus]NYB74473.1 radical SAM protein [Sedimentibacter hydroxybenzoicus DSM 7310]
MYSMPLYRPPSEARSLIIQITEGCSHNKCRFCYMYKCKQFRLKSDDEIKEHINELKAYYKNPDRIFLADGNVLCLKTDKLVSLLNYIKTEFPSAQRISSYSGPLDLIRKTDEELKLIREHGLEFLYLGVESGSDKVLSMMEKGVNQREMIEAGQKAVKAGFKLSCMIISGLGGEGLMEEHAVESAKVISAINPHYFSLLRLVVEEESELADDVRQGKFKLLNPIRILDENILMLENMELTDCIFRANHVSNYLNQAGVLNKDKDMLVERLKKFRESNDFIPMGNDRL